MTLSERVIERRFQLMRFETSVRAQGWILLEGDLNSPLEVVHLLFDVLFVESSTSQRLPADAAVDTLMITWKKG